MVERTRSDTNAPGSGTGHDEFRHVSNRECLEKLLNWFIPDDGIFAKLRIHGNTGWTARKVVYLALLWSWSAASKVTDAFADSVKWFGRLWGVCPLTSYTGFMGAMVKWHFILIDLLGPVLHARMQEVGGRFWRFRKWLPIAFDGSRTNAARTKSNEKAFCAPNYGQSRTAEYRRNKRKKPRTAKQVEAAKRKKKKAKTAAKIETARAARKKKSETVSESKTQKSVPQAPQVWITMMWHARLRLPWMWRLGPSNSNEREHVLEMLEQGQFAINTLFIGDAGFVGYPFWSAILKKKHQFLIRVGANVNLLSQSADYSVQDDGQVLCWPQKCRDKQPPLVLRLVKIVTGKTNVWILTSVVKSEDLSKSEIHQLYKMRWGIEVEFRGLKQTLDNGVLGSRAHKQALVELNWSVMAMAIIELFALKEQLKLKCPQRKRRQPAPDPSQRSLANSIRALRGCLSDLREVPEEGKDLQTLLRAALIDRYIRKSSKQARYLKANPDKKRLGDPIVRPMSLEDEAQLHSLHEKSAAS